MLPAVLWEHFSWQRDRRLAAVPVCDRSPAVAMVSHGMDCYFCYFVRTETTFAISFQKALVRLRLIFAIEEPHPWSHSHQGRNQVGLPGVKGL